MALPQFTISELIGAGVHFGHRSFRWNPKLKSSIYGTRNGIHIIDLQQTVPALYSALAAIEATVARGGRVLFVGTKKQAQQVALEAAEKCGMYYVNHRWLGGILTNWKTVSQSIRRLKDIEEAFKGSEEAQKKLAEMMATATPENPVNASMVKDPMSHLTKKEVLMRTRERANLRRVLGGIMNMAGLPDLLVVLSVHQDKIAVDEAARLGIPVVGIVDTNANPEGVTYMVPGNDDSTRALSLYARLCADAVLSGIAMQASLHQPVQAAASNAEGRTRAPRGPVTVTLSKAAKEVAAADEAAAATPAVSA
ncbi:MAG: 30S ribosomal protein S2 [Proteobacteria bacterium]|nr:30S ribosomal protein S2 [Pseudomonadota bacterium]NBX86263.1 30S ribosomal protein S2 [Pseudomonadota bacterium]